MKQTTDVIQFISIKLEVDGKAFVENIKLDSKLFFFKESLCLNKVYKEVRISWRKRTQIQR
jgi:hypothetical protein